MEGREWGAVNAKANSNTVAVAVAVR